MQNLELEQALARLLDAGPFRMVLSAPRPGQPYTRASLVQKAGGWQLEQRTATQAFHQNLAPAQLPATLEGLLTTAFSQLTAFSAGREHRLKLTKKGRVLTGSTAGGAAPAPEAPAHDRQKRHLFPEGTPVPPLVDMGVFTAEGKVVAAKRDKYRQIDRFVQLVEDALKPGAPQRLNIVEFGCGKSALSFVLYHYLTQMRGIDVHMTGLDLKADVVATCTRTAEKYGYTGLRFCHGDIAEYHSAEPVDMVLALHACDTATDFALAKAVAWDVPTLFSVPCCQHEANAQIESEALALLTRYGIVKERVAALMTDAIRANLLTACGYKTRLVEFVGFEHTPKNIMIRAVKASQPASVRKRALDEVRRLADAFHLSPCLLSLLEGTGRLP
ncbi:MAG: SAM-dependent methyltransferase [Oscillospiraceae bacterium]